VAVCAALAEIARAAGARQVFVLCDISLLGQNPAGYTLSPAAGEESKEQRLNVEKPCLMYIGNLEAYQGIDLLLESFARLNRSRPQAFLAIIGGNEDSIRKYQQKSSALGVAARVRFFGPRPLASMAFMFAQADILVSPRIKGINTPMKIYSYLQSGKPILATDLPTHTQVLDRTTAMLAEPKPDKFAAAMLNLLDNPLLCRQLAQCAVELANEKYSLQAYTDTVEKIYSWIEDKIGSRGTDR
jgi:glycosyltransferase involved in cell wall biosynthesis